MTFTTDADWIQVAYLTLAPLLGKASASILFAVALLASGQSSTITGTMAGQVVMEGFLRWRIRPWVRRLVTRLVAIVPAMIIIGLRGDDSRVTDLLNLSQVCPGPAIAAWRWFRSCTSPVRPEIHGKLRQRLVPAHRRLGELRAHHRPGHLGPAGSVQNRLERNRGE